MLLVALLALGLVVATVVLHYEGLRLISQVTLSHRQIGRPLMMLVVFGVILLHVLDIALYGTGFWVAGTQWHLGSLHSSTPGALGLPVLRRGGLPLPGPGRRLSHR